MIFGAVLEGIWGALDPWKSCQSVYLTVCTFRVWTLSVRSLFRDLLLEGVWHTFFKIWVQIGAPIGAPFVRFWLRFQGLNFEGGFWTAIIGKSI